MLNIIEFVKTDVITHCWQSCALSRDSKGNHPLHTHALTDTHAGGTDVLCEFSPGYSGPDREGKTPDLWVFRGLHVLVQITALLSGEAVFLTSNLLFFL